MLPIAPDPFPDLIIERGTGNDGVGDWVPTEKHLLLAKMLNGTRAARRKFPSRVLIDPFCGPGRIQVKGETVTRPGGAAIAWLQSQRDGVPFTHVLVGDINAERSAACTRRLRALGAPATEYIGPAVETIKQMVADCPRSALTLAYVDPYSLEVLSFEIIETLAKLQRVDLLVHFSTMDLQRNVEMELDVARARFDDAAPGWRAAIPVTCLPKQQLPAAFFKYWQSLITKQGFTFSKEMPLVRSAYNNAPLYRLLFFSRHPLPNRIWDDVARGPNHELAL